MILNEIQQTIEKIYHLDGIPTVDGFVLSTVEASKLVPSDTAPTPQVFFRQEGEEVRLGVYVSEKVLSVAESDGIEGIALSDFCGLAEEVSHFLCIHWRLQNERPMSLLDLELQGEIDKYLLACRYYGDDGELFGRMFERVSYESDLNPLSLDRYQEANRLGGKFCKSLGRIIDEDGLRAETLNRLRAFYRMDSASRLSHVSIL